MKIKLMLAAAMLTYVLGSQLTAAEDAYYRVQFTDLQFASGAVPGRDQGGYNWRYYQRSEQMEPRAVLDGEGSVHFIAKWENGSWMEQPSPESGALEIRVPAGREISGHLFLAKTDLSGMVALAFKAPLAALKPSTREKFLEAEEAHSRKLANLNIPGAAWFRHEAEEAVKARGGKPTSVPANPPFWRGQQPEGLDATFELFSGGRAVSENLQLDRALLATKPGDETQALTNLAGITVKPMDWKPLLTNPAPATDPLAAFIPADQHALFFRSFQGMTELLDEADGDGTPLLQFFESRSEDSDCRGRYQRQLCLGLNEISRRLGPQVIQSAAFTGSDPYLRTGSDVGVLFETGNSQLVKTFVSAGQAAAMKNSPEVRAVQGEIDGVTYSGVVSPDRTVSSYVATSSNVVYVCNSLYQLGRLIDTAQSKSPALISQEDYLYFRTRYPRNGADESAFLVLPDAAIRRWCGPRWRIANSRRTRAAALLADLQAAHLETVVKGETPAASGPDKNFPDAGEIQFTSHGVLSSVYGNLNFLTPVGEMKLDHVTKAEADAYIRWRDTYQQNWRQSFDPIAARFSLRPERVGVEVTVMPLILQTEYQQFVEVVTGSGIAPSAGDPHDDALAHFAMSINTDSASFKEAGGFIGSMSPLVKANPLGWMGQSLALFADEDPFWERFARATNKSTFMETNFPDLPVALHCEVKDTIGLVAFLTTLHAFADQSAPGMATWENHDYNGRPYVKIVPRRNEDQPGGVMEKLIIYYTASPGSLTVTLNENVLKHALDRETARTEARKNGKPAPAVASPWLGTNLCLKIDRHFLTALTEILDSGDGSSLRSFSWNNLPILNEWKRRFPNEDPVKLHERFWQTKLVCPGGGTYVWNEKWQTMESTVFGHPGEPKEGPKLALMPDMKNASLGLSFENAGLSAHAVVNREPKPH